MIQKSPKHGEMIFDLVPIETINGLRPIEMIDEMEWKRSLRDPHRISTGHPPWTTSCARKRPDLLLVRSLPRGDLVRAKIN